MAYILAFVSFFPPLSPSVFLTKRETSSMMQKIPHRCLFLDTLIHQGKKGRYHYLIFFVHGSINILPVPPPLRYSIFNEVNNI